MQGEGAFPGVGCSPDILGAQVDVPQIGDRLFTAHRFQQETQQGIGLAALRLRDVRGDFIEQSAEASLVPGDTDQAQCLQ